MSRLASVEGIIDVPGRIQEADGGIVEVALRNALFIWQGFRFCRGKTLLCLCHEGTRQEASVPEEKKVAVRNFCQEGGSIMAEFPEHLPQFRSTPS